MATAIFIPRMYSGDGPAKAVPVSAAVAETPAANNTRSVTIPRSANGHFHVDGSVDGRRVEFMVDTGASVIALRERDAARLGIHPAARDYTAKVSTANGVVKAARAELNRVDIGGVTVRNVAALVLPDEALSQNLLGMSFLSRLRWEQKNGKLILEQ
ncbi:MAG TPA: TIGR02281 family clan AA aspartic protease [Xanthobacteraceae bacterium]|nr:TIGR02281 family clan AA aspartic protease [Xanthobacteraceae bacterium]